MNELMNLIYKTSEDQFDNIKQRYWELKNQRNAKLVEWVEKSIDEKKNLMAPRNLMEPGGNTFNGEVPEYYNVL